MKDAAAAVTPSGVAPQGGFGDVNGGNGMMTNGQTAALGYSPDLKLPDGKRLAYRRVKITIFYHFVCRSTVKKGSRIFRLQRGYHLPKSHWPGII